ncbi:MAG TPA: LysM peptidoglycan-binding domain-containing protein [Blastocatellia bacterium]|nr:LysM peptidoglycan-binding domain-containing protein [Blastocatellia bacterium]
MGLFDKMFGRGASEDEKSRKRFEELRNKYQSVLNLADQQHVQFKNLHVEDDKLLIRAVAPSQDVANKIWDQIKLANPNLDDITADITVSQTAAQSAVTAGGQQTSTQGAVNRGVETGQGQSYTVKSGDTLSKISRQFYGDSNEYMRIFYANRDKLNDPDRIQVGQQLVIPPDTDA